MSPDSLVQLQRSVGNRAVVGMLARTTVGADADVVRRRNGKGKGKGKKKRKNQNRGGGGNQRTTTPPTTGTTTTPTTAPPVPTDQGWGIMSTLGSIGSYLWNSTSTGLDGEGDIDGGDVNQGGLGSTTGQTHLGGDKEPEPEPKVGDPIPASLVDQLLDIPQVSIKLEKEFGGGAKGQVGGSVGRQGAKGKAKVEWTGAAREADTGDVELVGGILKGKGSYFRGAKASGELEGEAGYDDKGNVKLGSKGKIAGFVGMEMKGETQVVVNVGGHETKVKGALGVTLGVGGELSYWLTFEGGKLSWGSKGKAALGVGAAWEYQLELPVASLSSSLWSWLSAGVMGLGSGLSTVGEYLSYLGYLE